MGDFHRNTGVKAVKGVGCMSDDQEKSTKLGWLQKQSQGDEEIKTLLLAAEELSLSSLLPVRYNEIESEPLQQVLEYWRKMRNGESIPLMENLDPARMGRWLSHITIVEVQYEPLAFLYRLTGEKLEVAHGGGLKGKDVRITNDLVPGLGDTLHLMHKKIVEYRRPVALRGDLVMENPSLKGAEFFFLPVSLDGERVDRLLHVAQYYTHSLVPLDVPFVHYN